MRTACLAGVLLGTLGCQSYDFQPVAPNAIEVQDTTQMVVGRALSPNIMLVVDRSGSMTDPANGGTVGSCAVDEVYAGRDAGDCKWNNLLDTLIGPAGDPDAGFLAQLDETFGANAAYPLPLGLAELPGPSNEPTNSIAYSCAASGQSVLNAIAGSNEAAITTSLLAIQPGGGTPTAATLQAAGEAFPAGETGAMARANYIILMTDGAPNCDSSFQGTSANCTNDRCTLGSCSPSAWMTPSCQCDVPGTGELTPEGCLDEQATVDAIAALYDGGIKTFVIGFGAAAVSPSSTETLEEMGQAGATGSSMGYGPSSYYQAASETDLQAALNAILGVIRPDVCTFALTQPPTSSQLIEVLVTPYMQAQETLTASQFSYSASTQSLTITDPAVCTLITASNPSDPVSVEIRYVLQE